MLSTSGKHTERTGKYTEKCIEPLVYRRIWVTNLGDKIWLQIWATIIGDKFYRKFFEKKRFFEKKIF